MTRSRKGFHHARPMGHLQRHALAAAVVLALGGAAQAQLSTATIAGQVTSAQAPAKAGLVVLATNLANGNTQRTTTRADGSYVLAGLAPGQYQLSIAGQKSQTITLAIGETAAVNLAVGGGQQVTIVGTLGRKDVRNSEVGTNVSPRAINALPQVTRNFLAFADLAPGARFDVENDMAIVRGGAQDRNNINVYIDGVSQKNNILRGGALGMDSSRGNPFPQSAVAEYKVITQNYKAEFDQVSSTAITAVTKSGTNTLHGEAFYDYTSDSLTAKNPQEKLNAANGNPRVPFTQKQYGLSLGGPIKQDVAHFFIAAEFKDIAKPRSLSLANVNPPVPAAGLGNTFLGYQGSYNQRFKQPLLALGKLDFELGNDQHLDLTLRLRKEDDFIAEDANLSAPGNDKTRRTEEQRLDLRHTLTRDQFVNEARVGYELYRWNPRSVSNSPLIVWYTSATDTANGNAEHAFLKTGGSPDEQDRKQTGFLLQNDFTYTGLAGHTLKTGAKLKLMEYDLGGTSRSVDILHQLIDKDTGQIVPDPANPTVDWFRREAAIAPVGVKYKNNQVGLYLQDDWRVNSQLELNLGVRWDFETNPLNNSYSTPAALVAALNKPDITRYGIAPAAGQTYAQSLAKGGIDINDYIATGSNRKKFYGALAPRLGFSYDLRGDRNTVVYAGYGRAYDRAMANYALDELQRSKGTGDQFMIRNDYKAPYSDQFSLGLRQAVDVWNTEVGVTHTHAKNQFNWFAGDRDPNGGWGPRANSIDPNWGAGPQGYGMLILGDFVTQQKTTAVFLRADKPYTNESGWTAGLTYTYSDGKTTHRDWNDDIFNWSYGKPGATGGWYKSKLVERHRLVATGLTDKLLPWNITLAGKLTLGSGLPRRVTACPVSWDACGSFYGDPASFRQVDMALSKGIKLPFGEVSLRLDVLNLFNTVNWNQYDDWGGGPGNPQNSYGGDNANTDKRTGTSNPMRTYKLSLRYIF